MLTHESTQSTTELLPDEQVILACLKSADGLAGYDTIDYDPAELIYDDACETRSYFLVKTLQNAGYSAKLILNESIADGIGWHIAVGFVDGSLLDCTYGQHVLPFAANPGDKTGWAYRNHPPLPPEVTGRPFLLTSQENAGQFATSFTEATHHFVTSQLERSETSQLPQSKSFLDVATSSDSRQALFDYYYSIFNPANYYELSAALMQEYDNDFQKTNI